MYHTPKEQDKKIMIIESISKIKSVFKSHMPNYFHNLCFKYNRFWQDRQASRVGGIVSSYLCGTTLWDLRSLSAHHYLSHLAIVASEVHRRNTIFWFCIKMQTLLNLVLY